MLFQQQQRKYLSTLGLEKFNIEIKRVKRLNDDNYNTTNNLVTYHYKNL